ncbi:GNAT family N-acetyltransferase [Lottiidibacillus patelloidae]|uniref:GNAT family N-acetyltransferase n=1 Tax=Lottiidibacillus patelloidae TaxID=2670334 RepID=A0A263BUA6_9BACI|nr:GNAT family N-acetyltransferase [Lottiidibacillus patelloidae]OZM57331.1 GNAT family N-acetyltransferase [Lottiidibacillus patelloidae]
MDPILIDFPQEFETERLKIRMPLPGDGAYVYDAVIESIEELKVWLPFANGEQTKEKSEISVRQSYSNFILRSDLRMHIFHKENGNFIGSTGLHRMDWQVRKFEIGYWIRTSEAQKGYMIEAIRGLTQFAFDQLAANRVEIRCDEQNERSKKIPEKLGYMLEGTLRNEDLNSHGKLRNTLVYSIIEKSNLK